MAHRQDTTTPWNGMHHAAQLKASRRFWNEALRAFAAPSTPVLVSYGPGRQGEPIGLSNRMYGSVSAILLALAAGARVEVDERILADLAKHDPPEDVLAAIRPRALNASSSSKGIVLDHRVRTAHSWQKLADWQPTDGFGSLVAGWNDGRHKRVIVWSGEWFGELLGNKTRPNGLPSLREMVARSGASSVFGAVAALLYRPQKSLADAVEAVVRASLPPGKTLALHVRSEIIFMYHNKENLTRTEREADRAETWELIARCALKRAREYGLTHAFIAADAVAGAREGVGVIALRLRAASLVVTASHALHVPRGVSAARLDSLLVGHGRVCLTTLGSTFSDIATAGSHCAKYSCTSCVGPLHWRTPVFAFWMPEPMVTRFLTPEQLRHHPSRCSGDYDAHTQPRRDTCRCAWFRSWGGPGHAAGCLPPPPQGGSSAAYSQGGSGRGAYSYPGPRIHSQYN